MGTIYRVHETQEGNPRLGDYTNNPDYYTPTPPLKCNMNAMSVHLESWHYALDLKRKVYTSKIQKRRCCRKVQLLNNVDVENDLLDKRVLPS